MRHFEDCRFVPALLQASCTLYIAQRAHRVGRDTGVQHRYIAGKGDGNIRYYEITEEAPYCHFLSQYQSSAPQRGLGWLPKIVSGQSQRDSVPRVLLSAVVSHSRYSQRVCVGLASDDQWGTS